MPRMSPTEGVEAYHRGAPPSFAQIEFDPEEHMEEMGDLVTGLVGALLKLGLKSLHSRDLGHRIPVLVTYVDGDRIRIFVDPQITPYGRKTKKGRPHCIVDALDIHGDRLALDTKEQWYVNHRALALELQRYA